MYSAEQIKSLVRGKLVIAAEEIFAVFQKVIVDYEKELERHRRFIDATWKSVVKLHKTG